VTNAQSHLQNHIDQSNELPESLYCWTLFSFPNVRKGPSSLTVECNRFDPGFKTVQIFKGLCAKVSTRNQPGNRITGYADQRNPEIVGGT
jgi:hypothetical protein